VQDLGRTVTGVGDMIIDREATAAAKERDTYIADQIRTLLYDPETGYANTEGRTSLDEMGRVQEALDNIKASATKDMPGLAGRKLEASLTARMERALDFVDKHASGQRKVWIDGASEARIISAQQDALIDPEETGRAIDTIAGEVAEQQRRDGLSDEEADLILDTRISELYQAQVAGLATDDPASAMAYLDANKDEMLPTTYETLKAQLAPDVKRQKGRNIGVVRFEQWKSGKGPADAKTLRDAIAAVESRNSGDYAAVGKVMTSGMYKGDRAYGRYQIMGKNIPSWSKAALGYEVSIEEFMASPEIQDTIFDHRFGVLINKHGNADDAASAWFTGQPLSVGKDRTDGNISGAEYVRRFNAALGGGEASETADMPMTAEQIEMQMRDEIEDPTERAAAITEFRARVGLAENEDKKAKEETYKIALDMVWGQGTAPSSMPPEVQDILKRNGLWDGINAEWVAQSSGIQQFNDYTWLSENYYNLSRDEQLQMPMSELKDPLDYESWTKEAKARIEGGATGPKRTTNALIKSRLADFGIKTGATGDTSDDKKARAREAEFYASYEGAIAEFTAEKKRAPTEAEEQKIVNDLTATWDLAWKDTWVPFDAGTREGAAFEVLTDENIAELSAGVDAPVDDVAAAIAFMQQFNMPMDQDTLERVLEAGAG
jgi:hypothetical protein